jgi:formiminoglutamase
MKHFRFFSRQDIQSITKRRRYETKLGEKFRLIEPLQNWKEALESSTAKYVLAGIPEDIGVRANYGIGGTDTAWPNFLQSFVNVQSTDKLNGEHILMLGHFDFEEVKTVIEKNAKSGEEITDACRHAVANIIDEEVEELVKTIVAAGKLPVIIGGGHNNSYPIVKGAAKGLLKTGKINKAQINVVNLDAHADFRIMEGRHSGNGFRYAMSEGYLGKYAVVGLQENHNPQSMLDDLYSDVNIQYTFFEDIFLHEKMNFKQAISQAFGFSDDQYTGIELDMDCIEHVLSSAMTPAGISPVHARQYMSFAGNYPKPAYLHICEGAAQLSNGSADFSTGKLISYLVADFLRSNIS